MQKKLTITLDETVYEALHKLIGRGNISKYIEGLLRPKLMERTIEDGYREMAMDSEREREALEWCNALAGDADEARCDMQAFALSPSRHGLSTVPRRRLIT